MEKITKEKIELIFKYANEFHLKEISLKEAQSALEKNNINQSTSRDYLYCYNKMLSGELYTRTINTTASEYYLHRIYIDTPHLINNALKSFFLHIKYYENTTKITMHKSREIYEKYNNLVNVDDEILEEESNLTEGSVKRIFVNAYERNLKARKECIAHYGCRCAVCGFDFEKEYGEIGTNYIQVHHLKEISSIKKEYVINPITDLIPVCPNCHVMLHRRNPSLTIEELKENINSK